MREGTREECTDDARRSNDAQAVEASRRSAREAERARWRSPNAIGRRGTASTSEARGEDERDGGDVRLRALAGMSQTRLGELRNRAVEAMKFAPSWLKQIKLPPGASAGNVVPVVGTFEELLALAEIAMLNSAPDEEIEAYFAGREEVKVLELSSCEQRAIVTTDHKARRHTISLRGTKNFRNVAQNMRLGIAPTGEKEDLPVPMHRGYRNIARKCLEAIEPLLIDGYEIQLTGHSLGGASAVALALLIHKKGKAKVQRVVTFGSPKLGPKETAEASEELDILRVVQKDDIIPLLPMSRPFVRRPYCHLGEGILLDNDNPGLFADLPREWGAAGILWRQRMSIKGAMTEPPAMALDASTLAKGITKPLAGAAKRARMSFLAAFSMPTNEIELEAEVKDLIANATESKASFVSIQEEFDASSAIPLSPFEDMVERESDTLSVGPTIFERLWVLRQYSPEERLERLNSHRMRRYIEQIKATIKARPQRVPLAEIYDPDDKPKQSGERTIAVPQLSEAILSIRSR